MFFTGKNKMSNIEEVAKIRKITIDYSEDGNNDFRRFEGYVLLHMVYGKGRQIILIEVPEMSEEVRLGGNVINSIFDKPDDV